MQIFIKTLSGSTIIADVDKQDTVKSVKEKIHKDRYGIPIDQMKLIFAGKLLENDKQLCDYNICREATLHIIFSLNPMH